MKCGALDHDASTCDGKLMTNGERADAIARDEEWSNKKTPIAPTGVNGLLGEDIRDRKKPVVQATTHTPADAEDFLRRPRDQGNGTQPFEKRRRGNSISDDTGHVHKKIPTGPRAMRYSTTTAPARPPSPRVDVAALSLLNRSSSSSGSSERRGKTASNQVDTARINVSSGPQSHVSSPHSISAASDRPGSVPAEKIRPKAPAGAQPPRIIKKRPAADPLRRNMGPNRPR